MLKLIDRVAGWWLDWRTDQVIKGDPEIQDLGFTCKAERQSSMTELVLGTPFAAYMADQLATLLNEANAENYVQFDMIPRIDRKLRPVRVTVQWANGLSPSEKAARLETEVDKLRGERLHRAKQRNYFAQKCNELEKDLDEETQEVERLRGVIEDLALYLDDGAYLRNNGEYLRERLAGGDQDPGPLME